MKYVLEAVLIGCLGLCSAPPVKAQTADQARVLCRIIDPAVRQQLAVYLELKAQGMSDRELSRISDKVNGAYEGVLKNRYATLYADALSTQARTVEEAILVLEAKCANKLQN